LFFLTLNAPAGRKTINEAGFMTVSHPLPVEIISESPQLDIAVQDMVSFRAIALDTESNSIHHYPEQLCLIQIATGCKVYIIDTLSLSTLLPLKNVLEDRSIQKVIHGADYDIRSLDRRYGFRVYNLYDTSIAARFTGITKFGLADLIKELLGITIIKSKSLQLTDWGRRPLSVAALDYASADVRYLFALRDILDQRLRDKERTAWVSEECSRLEEVRYVSPDIENAFLSLKGAHNLEGDSLAILRSLFLFREKEARRQQKPPFFVMPDSALIYLALNPTATLTGVPGLGEIGLKRFGPGLQQALRDGLKATPIQRLPVKYERLSQEQIRRLAQLKTWRMSLGATLSLDPSLLWPTASFERLVRAPATFDLEIMSAGVRRWQRDLFAASLQAYLES
jgi:ribonuclease D